MLEHTQIPTHEPKLRNRRRFSRGLGGRKGGGEDRGREVVVSGFPENLGEAEVGFGLRLGLEKSPGSDRVGDGVLV